MNLRKLLLFLFIFTIFLITSCSDDDKNSVDYDEIVKAKCDSVIANCEIPGLAIRIIAPEKEINLTYSAGEADLDQHIPMRADMTHRIGSVTKTFVVTVLLQLIEAGELNLDTTLDQYYPGIPQSDNITIEMLTDMTSGIKNYMETEKFWEIVLSDLTHYFAPDSLINMAVEAGADFDPGTSWHYSNTNTIIIGRIIEMITGNDLKHELEERIFVKLGMDSTEFLDEGTDIPGDNPHGYYAGEIDSLFYDCTEMFDISMAWSAGSIVSTLDDMQIYIDALVDGELISPELQQLRMECQNAVPGHVLKYGIGIADYNGFFGHNGGFPGFTTSCYKSPDKNCSFIIFFNCQLEEYGPDCLYEELSGIIYPDMVWDY